MPRWVITCDRFFLKSKDLFDEPTALYYSEGGEFSLDFKASKVHFVGGFCGLCLFTATLHALETTMNSGTDLNFYFHMGAIYSESEFGSTDQTARESQFTFYFSEPSPEARRHDPRSSEKTRILKKSFQIS